MQKTINDKRLNVDNTDSAGLDNLTHGTSQFGIGIILTLAALVGIWGAACLISGIAKSGNLLDMGRGFISAVLGI